MFSYFKGRVITPSLYMTQLKAEFCAFIFHPIFFHGISVWIVPTALTPGPLVFSASDDVKPSYKF